jgi:hypothetical protein
MMDAGAYAVSLARLLSNAEPIVDSAQAICRPGSQVRLATQRWLLLQHLTLSYYYFAEEAIQVSNTCTISCWWQKFWQP